MAEIVYFDPTERIRGPVRLVLPDAVASAFVRAGVAAAANPGETGALMVGGVLSADTMIEISLQHGIGGQNLNRFRVPLAVAQIAASAGVAAPVVGVLPPITPPEPAPNPTVVSPPAGWNGVTGSGFSSVPADSPTPYGSLLQTSQITGNFTWPEDVVLPIEDDNHLGVVHGVVGEDPVIGRLASVQIYLESDTPVTITGMQWADAFKSFGALVSLRTNDRNGIAQGYVRLIPVHGKDIVLPFKVWLNNPAVTAGYINRHANAVWVDPTIAANPTTSVGGNPPGAQANPYKSWVTAGQSMKLHTSGVLNGQDRRGGKIYLVAGSHPEDVVTIGGGTAGNLSDYPYPSEICPAPGLTVDDVIVTRNTRGNMSTQLQHLILNGVTIDFSKFAFISTSCPARTIAFMNFKGYLSEGPNGPLETWAKGDGTNRQFRRLNSDVSNNLFPSNAHSTGVKRGKYIINARLDADLLTGYTKMVNVRGLDGVSPAQITWDSVLHSGLVSDAFAVFNAHVKLIDQADYHKTRKHTLTEVAISTDAVWNPAAFSGLGSTTLTFAAGSLTGSSITAGTGLWVLEGIHQGEYYGPEDQINIQTGTTQTITLKGINLSGMTAGTRVRAFGIDHADALQLASTLPIRNMYFQNYEGTGQDLQTVLLQVSNAAVTTLPGATTSGTTLTFPSAATLYDGDGIWHPVTKEGRFIVGSMSGVSGTTFTLDRPFSADITTGTTLSVKRGLKGLALINCVLHKTEINDGQGQIEGPVQDAGFACCTILGDTGSYLTANSTILIKANSPGIAINKLAFRGTIIGAMSTDGPLFLNELTFDRCQFLRTNGTASQLPGTRTNTALGLLTFDSQYHPNVNTTNTVDADLAAAFPWDRDGNPRRAGDPLGAVARLS